MKKPNAIFAKERANASLPASEPKQPAPTLSPARPDNFEIKVRQGQNADKAKADLLIAPYVANVFSTLKFSKGSLGEMDLQQSVSALLDKVELVSSKNNLAEVEGMLVSQAYCLNLMFSELTRRSAINLGDYMEASQRYLSMAMKAQNQCRMTLETLANIKNPRVVYARQANVTSGPQQINNTVNNGHAPATKPENQPNKLVEVDHEASMDTRAAGLSRQSDSHLEAMDTLNGTEDR